MTQAADFLSPLHEQGFMARDILTIVREVLGYVRENREYWLLPALAVLLVLGALLLTAGSSPVPVFIYPVA